MIVALSCAAASLAGAAATQTFRSGVNLVLLQVTVTDAADRFAKGLVPADFSVYEDGVQRPIEQFSAERVPVSVGILVDASASMQGRRFADAQQALARL